MNKHEHRTNLSPLDITKVSIALIGTAAVLTVLGASVYTAEQMSHSGQNSGGSVDPSYTLQGVGQMGNYYYKAIGRTLENFVGIHTP